MSTTFDLEPQSTTTSTSIPPTTLLSDLCPFCNESPPKYRCPACDARTCSLKCSKRHKAYKQCPGTRDPTAYIKRSKLATPSALNRDFNFLTGVERAVARGSGISTDDGDEQGSLSRNTEQKKKQAAEAREAWIEKSGVIVKKAPQGMKRSSENMTDVVRTKKARLLHWTVEWVLSDEGNKRILDNRVMETSRLTSAFFHPNNGESRKKSKVEMAKTRFYLKKVGVPANRPTLIPLNPATELRDCIRGRIVDEYPTIYVTATSEHPRGFEIAQSIAADAGGKLEVLEETSRVDIAINTDKVMGAIGSGTRRPEEDIPAIGGAETKISGKPEDDASAEGRKPLGCIKSLVDGSHVVDGEANEDRAAVERVVAGGTQEGLVESALLELIGANGISIEAMEGSLERTDDGVDR